MTTRYKARQREQVAEAVRNLKFASDLLKDARATGGDNVYLSDAIFQIGNVLAPLNAWEQVAADIDRARDGALEQNDE